MKRMYVKKELFIEGKKHIVFISDANGERAVKLGANTLFVRFIDQLKRVDTLVISGKASTIDIFQLSVFCSLTKVKNLESENPNFIVENKMLISADRKTLLYDFERKKSIDIPEGIENIHRLSINYHKYEEFRTFVRQRISIPSTVKEVHVFSVPAYEIVIHGPVKNLVNAVRREEENVLIINALNGRQCMIPGGMKPKGKNLLNNALNQSWEAFEEAFFDIDDKMLKQMHTEDRDNYMLYCIEHKQGNTEGYLQYLCKRDGLTLFKKLLDDKKYLIARDVLEKDMLKKKEIPEALEYARLNEHVEIAAYILQKLEEKKSKTTFSI